jgi:hypothetical protein
LNVREANKLSTISDIFGSYRDALKDSQERYHNLYTARIQNAHEFYESFFNKLIKQYRPLFTNPAPLHQIKRNIYNSFESDRIDFVAIDGTCSKDQFRDFITFFGGAYGAKGRISLEGDPPKVHYEKWAINKDVSMVAYVPIPFAQISDVADYHEEESFVVSDSERVNLSNIHTILMQLAEVFLAYNVVTASVLDAPKLLMMDLSPSSLLAGVAIEAAAVHLAGQYPYDRRTVDYADILIAFAHPFNDQLGIPTAKKFKRYALLVAELDRAAYPNPIDLKAISTKFGIPVEELKHATKPLIKYNVARLEVNHLIPLIDVRNSWDYTIGFFQNLCKRLFISKDPSALIYEATEANVKRRRWLSPNDVKFLISVGMRAIVEECWKRHIMLTGVVKDSDSRYLSRNYLGIVKHLNFCPEMAGVEVHQLPWTDRIFLETLPVCDEGLEAPWSTIEIDSAFMTLFMYNQQGGCPPFISGVRGQIVAHEKLFARSLAQFFLRRGKSSPLTGHVVFLDRLIDPVWDGAALDHLRFTTPALGPISLLAYPYANNPNQGQTMMMYFLSVLTKNHFPEVIGYPDPLHKADWGAKSIGIKARKLIASSEISFRANPLSRTFRTIRDSLRRI